MNHTQKSSSFPHTLCIRQFYRCKKPLFKIGGLLFGATRMPQARPSTYATTAKPEPYRRQARIRPVRSGFDPQPEPLPLPSLPTPRIFREVCRVTAISAHRKNKNPDVSATFFRLRTLFHSRKAEKGPFCSCLLHFLSRDLRIGTTRQSAIAKKLHPDPIFCFWALEIVSGWHRGTVAVRAAKQKPGISLACMSENDAPPCGPQILEMQRAPLRAPSPHKQPHSPARLPFGELRSPLAFTFPLLRAPQHV